MSDRTPVRSDQSFGHSLVVSTMASSPLTWTDSTERYHDNKSLQLLCLPTFPTTRVYYTDLRHHIVDIVLLFLCVLLTCLTVAAFLVDIVGKHYRYKQSRKRRRVLVVLGAFPVTAVLACLSVLLPSATELTDIVQSCYVSVSLYMFAELLIQYCGGEDHMTDVLTNEKMPLQSPPLCCCLCCLPKVDVTRGSVRRIRTTVIQVAIVRPILLFAGAVMVTDSPLLMTEVSLASPRLYLTLLNGASTLLAMYGVIVLVRLTVAPLKRHRVRGKFLFLQLVIIFTNLQNVIFVVLSKVGLPPCRGVQGPNVRGSMMHHMILVLEMLVLTLLCRRVYRKSENKDLPVLSLMVYSDRVATLLPSKCEDTAKPDDKCMPVEIVCRSGAKSGKLLDGSSR